MDWKPIDTAPKDGSLVDLWMVNEDGRQWREENIYWNDDPGEWYRIGVGCGCTEGPVETARHYNDHPCQKKWIFEKATHWARVNAPIDATDEAQIASIVIEAGVAALLKNVPIHDAKPLRSEEEIVEAIYKAMATATDQA